MTPPNCKIKSRGGRENIPYIYDRVVEGVNPEGLDPSLISKLFLIIRFVNFIIIVIEIY